MYNELVYYESEPEDVFYQVRPDGIANVYLRKNIHSFEYEPEETEEEQDLEPSVPSIGWCAEEVYFYTSSLSKREIEENFDSIWNRYYKLSKPVTDRLETVEENDSITDDAIADLSELISELMGAMSE